MSDNLSIQESNIPSAPISMPLEAWQILREGYLLAHQLSRTLRKITRKEHLSGKHPTISERVDSECALSAVHEWRNLTAQMDGAPRHREIPCADGLVRVLPREFDFHVDLLHKTHLTAKKIDGALRVQIEAELERRRALANRPKLAFHRLLLKPVVNQVFGLQEEWLKIATQADVDELLTDHLRSSKQWMWAASNPYRQEPRLLSAPKNPPHPS